MKKELEIPEFENEDEEREFWSKIDLSEYFEPDDFKETKDLIKKLKRSK